jgi:hypothetical protein
MRFLHFFRLTPLRAFMRWLLGILPENRADLTGNRPKGNPIVPLAP